MKLTIRKKPGREEHEIETKGIRERWSIIKNEDHKNILGEEEHQRTSSEDIIRGHQRTTSSEDFDEAILKEKEQQRRRAKRSKNVDDRTNLALGWSCGM